jgi:5-(carboxyamino)imidazole ribonucleotide synthase
MIVPEAMLGILGGGQLGRMFVQAARTMGYGVTVFDPDPHSPAAQLANRHICADFQSASDLEAFGQSCAAITTEFENIPTQTLHALAQFCPTRPDAKTLAVAQDRLLEKQFMTQHGFPVADYVAVETAEQAAQALRDMAAPALMKLRRSGYDGKGQQRVLNPEDAATAFIALGGRAAILERLIDIDTELSVIAVRSAEGKVVTFPVAQNHHDHGILSFSVVPSGISSLILDQAIAMTLAIAERLEYCGVLTVEYFVDTQGRLLVNEIAPRPHNTGHYSLDACNISQFELQVRALCDLPLPAPVLHSPAVMVNLLGDLWQNGRPPNWQRLLSDANVRLHLYGKREARPKRKMGHFTYLHSDAESALQKALQLHSSL